MTTPTQEWYEWARLIHAEVEGPTCRTGTPNPTIYVDPVLRDEHLAFIRWMQDESVPYWDMSGAAVEQLKREWRACR